MSNNKREDVEAFMSSVVTLKRQVELFDQLFCDESVSGSLKSFMPETFDIICYSIFKSVAIDVCAFFDPKDSRGNKNLSLDYIEHEYASVISDGLRFRLDDVRNKYKNLQIGKFRSKYLAHHDLKHYTGEKSVDQNLSTHGLVDLLDSLLACVLEISNSHPQDGIWVPREEFSLPLNDNGIVLAAAVKMYFESKSAKI